MLAVSGLQAQSTRSRGLFGWGVDSHEEDAEGYFYYRGMMNVTGSSVGGYTLFNQIFGCDIYGGYNIYNQSFGQDEVPLGNGLLILTVAATGYAFRKAKNTNKKKS